MRKLLVVVVTVVAGLVAVPAAQADSPHFLFATNSIDTSTGALNTSFKEVGLGTGATSVGITLTADATATYQCYNKAGNKPQGVPKSFGPSGVSGSANFPVRHGQTTGTASAKRLGGIGRIGRPMGANSAPHRKAPPVLTLAPRPGVTLKGAKAAAVNRARQHPADD